MTNIVSSNELPAFPNSLSKEAKDFIQCCLKRETTQRANVFKLLKHPFIIGHVGMERPIMNNYDENDAMSVMMEKNYSTYRNSNPTQEDYFAGEDQQKKSSITPSEIGSNVKSMRMNSIKQFRDKNSLLLTIFKNKKRSFRKDSMQNPEAQNFKFNKLNDSHTSPKTYNSSSKIKLRVNHNKPGFGTYSSYKQLSTKSHFNNPKFDFNDPSKTLDLLNVQDQRGDMSHISYGESDMDQLIADGGYSQVFDDDSVSDEINYHRNSQNIYCNNNQIPIKKDHDSNDLPRNHNPEKKEIITKTASLEFDFDSDNSNEEASQTSPINKSPQSLFAKKRLQNNIQRVNRSSNPGEISININNEYAGNQGDQYALNNKERDRQHDSYDYRNTADTNLHKNGETSNRSSHKRHEKNDSGTKNKSNHKNLKLPRGSNLSYQANEPKFPSPISPLHHITISPLHQINEVNEMDHSNHTLHQDSMAFSKGSGLRKRVFKKPLINESAKSTISNTEDYKTHQFFNQNDAIDSIAPAEYYSGLNLNDNSKHNNYFSKTSNLTQSTKVPLTRSHYRNNTGDGKSFQFKKSARQTDSSPVEDQKYGRTSLNTHYNDDDNEGIYAKYDNSPYFGFNTQQCEYEPNDDDSNNLQRLKSSRDYSNIIGDNNIDTSKHKKDFGDKQASNRNILHRMSQEQDLTKKTSRKSTTLPLKIQMEKEAEFFKNVVVDSGSDFDDKKRYNMRKKKTSSIVNKKSEIVYDTKMINKNSSSPSKSNSKSPPKSPRKKPKKTKALDIISNYRKGNIDKPGSGLGSKIYEADEDDLIELNGGSKLENDSEYYDFDLKMSVSRSPKKMNSTKLTYFFNELDNLGKHEKNIDTFSNNEVDDIDLMVGDIYNDNDNQNNGSKIGVKPGSPKAFVFENDEHADDNLMRIKREKSLQNSPKILGLNSVGKKIKARESKNSPDKMQKNGFTMMTMFNDNDDSRDQAPVKRESIYPLSNDYSHDPYFINASDFGSDTHENKESTDFYGEEEGLYQNFQVASLAPDNYSVQDIVSRQSVITNGIGGFSNRLKTPTKRHNSINKSMFGVESDSKTIKATTDLLDSSTKNVSNKPSSQRNVENFREIVNRSKIKRNTYIKKSTYTKFEKNFNSGYDDYMDDYDRDQDSENDAKDDNSEDKQSPISCGGYNNLSPGFENNKNHLNLHAKYLMPNKDLQVNNLSSQNPNKKKSMLGLRHQDEVPETPEGTSPQNDQDEPGNYNKNHYAFNRSMTDDNHIKQRNLYENDKDSGVQNDLPYPSEHDIIRDPLANVQSSGLQKNSLINNDIKKLPMTRAPKYQKSNYQQKRQENDYGGGNNGSPNENDNEYDKIMGRINRNLSQKEINDN